MQNVVCVYFLFCLLCAISSCQMDPPDREEDQNFFDPSEEARLIRFLLAKYTKHGKHARPVMDTNLTAYSDFRDAPAVNVRFGLRLMHLDLDEQKQTMKTSSWIRMQWYDEYLKWDVKYFSGITRVTLPFQNIWTPDILLMNTVDSEQRKRLPAVQVKSTGSVFWTPHAEFASACRLDTANFPFDTHTCDMWFQSISNPSWKLRLKPYTTSWHNTSLDLSTYLGSYANSQEWEILANETNLFEMSTDAGIRLMYSRRHSLRFRLVLGRRAGFKGYLLSVPCIALSAVIVVTFCLPPSRPDRHAIAMSLFTSCLLLLLILSSEAPPTAASTPKLCFYYGYNMIAIIASIFCSVLVVYVHGRKLSHCKVPQTVRKITGSNMIKILGLKPPSTNYEKEVADDGSKAETISEEELWIQFAKILDRLFFMLFTLMGLVAFTLFFPWI